MEDSVRQECKQKQAKISIIIPTLNEANNIENAIAATHKCENVEVIVVDGGSKDDTVEIIESLNESLDIQSHTKVIFAPPGRALQMNAGAKIARGEILLFLHADTRLSTNFDVMVRKTLENSNYIAGAFTLRIDAPILSLRLVEFGVKLRSHILKLPYGDQGIFVRKSTFEKVNGFPELPIMEDFEFIRQLKRTGKITIIPVPVITSSRRWLKKGVIQTTLINQIVIIAFFLGISPDKLRNWYRQGKLRLF
ncbi:MAG: TIGR04283 family arsenosugar biosynthesis glycosyltransferase [Cyanobacteria bacterium P01_A01_bin.84]